VAGNMTRDATLFDYEIWGVVSDENDTLLQWADVEAVDQDGNVWTGQTDVGGIYHVSLPNGTYNVTVSLDGYESNSTTVVVDGADERQDFTLTALDGADDGDDGDGGDAGGGEDAANISGQVDNKDGKAIEGATVTLSNVGLTLSTDTGEDGRYEFTNVSDGTYDITAEHPDYLTRSEEVDVSGADLTVDFRLWKPDEAIRINTREFLKHGQETEFVVEIRDFEEGGWTDVTNNTELDYNWSVVTINSSSKTMTATDNEWLNAKTNVTAKWYDPRNNEERITSTSVTVANETVGNIEVLPPMQRFTATIGDSNTQVILVATGTAAAVAAFATSLAGLAAFVLVIIAGWVAGFAGTHVVIAGLLIGIMLGLNVSQVVEYR